jgi:hypothetical protein
MATRRYTVTPGMSRDKDVTEAVGAAITAGRTQITVDLAVAGAERDVLKDIDAIARYIRKNKWPPA